MIFNYRREKQVSALRLQLEYWNNGMMAETRYHKILHNFNIL